MITGVSSFIPTTIGRAQLSRQLPDVAQTPAIQAAGQSAAVASPTPSFADKLQSFFTLSPSDFSALFSDAVSSVARFPQTVSAAYTQSNLLTATRLSVNA